MAPVFGAPSRRSMLGPQPSSNLRSAPSYGFGTAERSQLNAKMYVSKDMIADKYGLASPGPVYHPTGSIDGRFHTAPSHSFGVSHRHPKTMGNPDAGLIPGPGQYTMPGAVSRQHNSQKRSYSSWKFGTSTRGDQAKVFISQAHARTTTEYVDSPGPCAYRHKGGMGAQSDSRKKSNESFGMGTSSRFYYESASRDGGSKAAPGPGAYTLRSAQGRQVTSDKMSYPIASFPRADRDRTAATVYLGRRQQQSFWGRNSPGPAVYAPTASVGNQVSSSRPNMPKFGFGTADRFAYINIGQRAMQSPGPGSYSI
jgi:hypothetical protein